jgi:hypothetical protein
MVKSILWSSSYFYNQSVFIPFGFAPLIRDDDIIYGLCATKEIIDWQKLKEMSNILEDLYKKIEEENHIRDLI